MKIIYPCVFLSFALAHTTLAQSTTERCGTDYVLQKELLQNPVYQNTLKSHHQNVDEIIRSLKTQQNRSEDEPFTIPVVVHVIHKGEPVGSGTNISEAQILSAISSLNQAYSGAYSTQSANTQIQFSLAKRDPYCNPTNGINRINGSGTSNYENVGLVYSGGTDNETAIKNLSKWPKSLYYNIWIVSEINDNNGEGGTQGYAYMAPAYSNNDGAVILYNAFGYDPDGSKGHNLKSYARYNITAIHEVAHGMGLYHTFQGDLATDGSRRCPLDSDCGNNGDCVSDTRKHIRDFGCPSGSNACDGGLLEEVNHNFLSYASDECQTTFTLGQKQRMRASILASRSSLLNSLACVAPNESAPAPTCSSNTIDLDNFYEFGIYEVRIADFTVKSGSAKSDGGYADRSCFYRTALEPGTNYPIFIKNGFNTENVRIWIDYNNNGSFSDPNELIFSGNSNTQHSGTFTTPEHVVYDQALRIRVMSDKTTNSITGPCHNPLMGQTEDYSMHFLSTPQCDLTLSLSHVNESAPGAHDGAAQLTVDGATQPMQYQWDNGATTDEIINISAGIYRVTITDANQCTGVDSVEVTAETPSNARTQVVDSLCGQILPDLNTPIYCNAVAGAQQYEWKVENTSLAYRQELVRFLPDTEFNLSWLSGIQYDTPYEVSVRAMVDDAWEDYGVVCILSTPKQSTTSIEGILDHHTTHTLYPNPAESNAPITLIFEEQAPRILKTVRITNALGQVVYHATTQEKQIALNLSLNTGVYQITVHQNNRYTSQILIQR